MTTKFHLFPSISVEVSVYLYISTHSGTLKINFRNVKRRNEEKKKNRVQEREVVTDQKVIKDQIAKNVLK